MKKSAERKFSINKKIIFKEADGLIYILDANEGKLRSLNETASFIWTNMKKPVSRKEILAKLLQEFDIDLETAKKDLNSFLEKYSSKGLIG